MVIASVGWNAADAPCDSDTSERAATANLQLLGNASVAQRTVLVPGRDRCKAHRKEEDEGGHLDAAELVRVL